TRFCGEGGIPLTGGGIVLVHERGELREGVLGLARLSAGGEGLGNFWCAHGGAEPTGAPEEKGHEDEEAGEEHDGEGGFGAHAAASGGRRCGRRRRWGCGFGSGCEAVVHGRVCRAFEAHRLKACATGTNDRA